MPYYQLGFGGQQLLNGQKVHELVAQTHNIMRAQSPDRAPLNQSNTSSPLYNRAAMSAIQQQEPDKPRFDYNTYMQNLQQKLAEHQSNTYQPNLARQRVGLQAELRGLQEDPYVKDRFRQKIMEKLGSIGGLDSGGDMGAGEIDHNFAEGLDVPSDLEYENEL